MSDNKGHRGETTEEKRKKGRRDEGKTGRREDEKIMICEGYAVDIANRKKGKKKEMWDDMKDIKRNKRRGGLYLY